MTPERRQLLTELTRRALELDAGRRTAFLDLACGTDAELRREVELLLSSDEQETGRLQLPASGQRVGRFEVLGSLGAGGMGEVYLARDPTLGRRVALKLLPLELAREPEWIRRFQQEARAASALNHPNVCVIHEVGEGEDGRHFIAMEYVEGQTLRQRLAAGPLPLEEALAAMRQAADALSAAHRAGIVHRDLKPENLMLREDGYLKVLDFGLAKLTEARGGGESDPGPVHTAAGTVMGTFRYMSPEQARGQAVDARTDVWSLGAVLYELLSGRPPFAGETAGDVVAAILLTEPEPLAACAAGVPVEVERVVSRALRKAAEQRFATASELAGELKRVEQALRLERGRPGPTAANRSEVTARLEVPAAPTRADGGAARPGPPTNLPPPASPLIGRERELEEVIATLRAADTRLLTLSGAGGTGKTRLAVEAARLLLAEFPDGVFAVDLSTLTDAELLASHIAQGVGLKEAPGAPVDEQLARFLADRHLLLVLDNFEHLLTAAPFVADLLTAAPRLTVLATSRALLRLRQEHEYSVAPLAVPGAASLPPLAALARTPAVALFVERAREAKPAFALTAENARAVVEICRRLDGLPLALELAAARVKLLAPAALLTRLENRLKLLVGGARDLPARQQTMRAAIQWSYELLEAPEQVLLGRLAVFAGGATLEAAEAVCGADELEVLDALGSLVDKSLLRQRESEDGEGRFLMLEVVREYALEQLEASGEGEAARLAHARYFLRQAEEAAPNLLGAEQGVWVEWLAREHENLRATLAVLLKEEPEVGARCAAALQFFWVSRNLYTEARGWLARALGAGVADPAVRTTLLRGLSNVERNLGDMGAAAGHAREAVEAARASGDQQLLAVALNTLGITVVEQGRHGIQARAAWEEGLAIARGLGDGSIMALFLCNLGEAAREDGDYRTARSHYEQALEAGGRHVRTTFTTIGLLNLGGVSLEEGDPVGARAFYREGLAIVSEIGDAFLTAYALDGIAAVALEGGAREAAARLAGAAEAVYDTVGAPLDPWEQSLRDRYVSKLRATFDPGELEREWERGRALTIEQAVRFALEEAEG